LPEDGFKYEVVPDPTAGGGGFGGGGDFGGDDSGGGGAPPQLPPSGGGDKPAVDSLYILDPDDPLLDLDFEEDDEEWELFWDEGEFFEDDAGDDSEIVTVTTAP